MRRRLESAWPYLAPLAALLWLWRAALAHPFDSLPTDPFGDIPARFAPLRNFGFSQLRAGHLALWNPRVFGGMPHAGEIETALFYPPNWIHLVLPLGLALNVVLLLHLWLAAALTTLWARRLGASRAGAALAGLSWALSGPVFAHLYAGHLTLLCALAWTPLLYAGVDRWLAQDAPDGILAGAAASALQCLAGHPQTAFYSALGALIYAALKLPRRRRARAAAGLAALFAGAGGLAAIQLLPTLEAARESSRPGAGYDFAASFSLPPESLLTLVAPHWLGGAAFPYVGRLYYWEASLFAGVATLLLAFACARPLRRGLLGAAAALGVLALGAHTPLFRLLWLTAPGFSLFRGTAKFSAQAVLLLCAAGGLGYDRAVRDAAVRRALWRAAAVLAAALALAAAAALLCPAWTGILPRLARTGEALADPRLYADPAFARAWARESAGAFGWAALASAAVAAAVAARRGRALWLIAAAEVLCFAAAHVGLSPVQQTVPPELAAALARDPDDVRFTTDWTRHPNLSMVVGRDEIWGYDQLPLERWAALGAFTQGRRDPAAGPYQRLDRATRWLALMRCRYVLLESPAPRVARLRTELPRAFLARARPAAPGAELDAMSAPDFDPASQAVVADFAVEASSRTPHGSASARELSTDAVEVEAETDAPAILVMTDAYSAGWTARALPGSAQARYDVVPVDEALRGVPLAPGRHRLLLSYAPRVWPLGVALSALSLLAWCGAALALRRRERRA